MRPDVGSVSKPGWTCGRKPQRNEQPPCSRSLERAKGKHSLFPPPPDHFFLQLFQLIEAIIRTGKRTPRLKVPSAGLETTRFDPVGSGFNGLCALNADYSDTGDYEPLH